jgi:hypothetical protein
VRLLGAAKRPAAIPEAGDPFTATAGRPIGRLVSVEPGLHLAAKLACAYIHTSSWTQANRAGSP